MTGSVLSRILESWWAPRRVVGSLAAMPEAGKLAVLMVAMLVFLVAQGPAHARMAQLDPAIPLQARITGALLAVMFLMPLLAYMLAGLTAVLSRLTPWRVGAEESRLALFWALLAVSPAMLLSGLVAGLVGPGSALTLVQTVSGIGFLAIWGAGLQVLSRRG